MKFASDFLHKKWVFPTIQGKGEKRDKIYLDTSWHILK